MSKRSKGGMFRLAGGAAAAALAWRAAKRAWLYVQGTRVEPHALPAPSQPAEPEPSEAFDAVDQAIDESFPASDPPSYAGSRGRDTDSDPS